MKKACIPIIVALVATLWATACPAFDIQGVDIHGFISQGYVDTAGNNFFNDTEDGSFEFNEMGINFSTQLTDKLRAGVQFFARDLGETGNNEIEVDWAYADYRHQDWLGLRFGLMKTPQGLYNETRDIDMLRNWIFLPQSVYPEVLRDTALSLQGVGTYGNIDLKGLGGLSYQAMYGTQDIDQNDRTAEALIGFYSSAMENLGFDVDQKIALGLVWDTPLQGLRLSGTYGKTKMEVNQRFTVAVPLSPTSPIPVAIPQGTLFDFDYDKQENWVGSAEFTWNKLLLVAEYIETKREFAVTFRVPTPFGQVNITGEDTYKDNGWYVGGAYRFTDWFELGAYYSETDAHQPFDHYPEFFYEQEDICLTARFDINMYWTFKLEYHDLSGGYGLSAWDNPPSSPSATDNFDKNWEMYAAKLTVAF